MRPHEIHHSIDPEAFGFLKDSITSGLDNLEAKHPELLQDAEYLRLKSDITNCSEKGNVGLQCAFSRLNAYLKGKISVAIRFEKFELLADKITHPEKQLLHQLVHDGIISIRDFAFRIQTCALQENVASSTKDEKEMLYALINDGQLTLEMVRGKKISSEELSKHNYNYRLLQLLLDHQMIDDPARFFQALDNAEEISSKWRFPR